ncbi:MAG: DUF4340 domain-containing protein [Planctomycetes bacterium]|nr:DUF4340 domain-containing protein [Planctomycetota bacterium]
MSNTKLSILAIVAVIMVLLAVGVSRVQKKAPSISELRYLIGSLNPDQIESVVLTGSGKTITLDRKGKGFQLADKSNYPADISKINDLITASTEIKIGEVYTSDTSNHADLGVTKETAASVLTFLKADNSAVASVLIGNTKKQGNGTYVRLANSNDVYVTLNDTSINMNTMNYIDSNITGAVNRDDVVSVMVTSGEEGYKLVPAEDGRIKLKPLEQGRTLNETAAAGVLTAISYLQATDVLKSQTGLDFTKSFLCQMNDSTVYTVNIAEKNEKYFVKVYAEYTGKLPTKDRTREETEEELKEKEAKFLARDAAINFTTKHNGWIYEITSYAAGNMTKPLEELLEEVEEPEVEKAETTE